MALSFFQNEEQLEIMAGAAFDRALEDLKLTYQTYTLQPRLSTASIRSFQNYVLIKHSLRHERKPNSVLSMELYRFALEDICYQTSMSVPYLLEIPIRNQVKSASNILSEYDRIVKLRTTNDINQLKVEVA